MARGLQAVAFLVALVLAISLMGTIGAYGAVNAGSYDTQADQDVNRIVETFESQNSSVTGVAQLDPIASFIIGGLQTLEVMWIIISDTSALFQLIGVPTAIADTFETLARLAFGVMVLYVVIRQRLD